MNLLILYDKTKVPIGHRPKIRLRKDWWVTDELEYETNNWLIDMFGTEPISPPIRIPIRYDIQLKNSPAWAGLSLGS